MRYHSPLMSNLISISNLLRALALSLALSGILWSHGAQAQNAETTVVAPFDAPFLFAYGTWQDKVKIEAGHALLRGAGVTGQGGAGVNANLNLSAHATDYAPALRLKVSANNQVKVLKLMLCDTHGRKATYEFVLPAPGADFVLVTPREGAPLALPNSVEKGLPDFAAIMQWQLIGDWNPGPLDIEIQSIDLTAPTDSIRAERVAAQQRLAAAAEQLRLERLAQKAKYPRGAQSPIIENVAPVAPDVLAVDIVAGHVIPGSVVPYVKQDGDTTTEKKDDQGKVTEVRLVHGRQDIGWLIGPKRDWLTRRESFTGDPLLEFIADDSANFALTSPDDAAFAQAVKPVAVGRKSRPINWAQDSSDMEMRHTLYLRWPQPLTPGKQYVVHLGELNTRQDSVTFTNDATKLRSAAVHVNQIGYRPDDPVKRAFVSCWLGTTGPLTLSDNLNFSLVDDKSGRVVFRGHSEARWPANKPEQMQHEANFNGTDVARLDFSAFKVPGRYRVSVAGIGCSYPFEIGPEVWRTAFRTQMQGLFNERSGIELGPPSTAFHKPPDMNPNATTLNSTRVTWTKYRAVEKGGEAFDAIAAGDTGQPAPGWGGYHDAGDWNPRRVTHMKVTLAQLELLDLFPRYFSALKLNIPPHPGEPDILNEAIFEFECFHRLQQKDGGVGYGLETQGDPLPGEVSWLQSFPIYAMSPDYASSWFYALVGARLSYLLQPYDAPLAATYRASAVAAFNWAEGDFARDKAAGLTQQRGDTWQAIDTRNFAALELYRLTRDKNWHDLFLENTVLKDDKPELFAWGKAVQRDQAFLYARLPEGLGDPVLKQKAKAGVVTMAERALTYAAQNAFNLTTSDQGKPQFLGFYSTPDATDLIHAHFLTGAVKYLAGTAQATQFQGGCNPNNIVYTSGLGANPIQHPLHLDARRTGQAAPVGFTPYGNVDLSRWHDNGITWPITWFLSHNTTPDPYQWPTTEAYWDLGSWPMLEEFTVDLWAPNIAVWGYLAARPVTP